MKQFYKDRFPKNYGSYDMTIKDCEKCTQGLLYQGCFICKDKQACGGWNDKQGQPLCCSCYIDEFHTKRII